MRLLALTRKFVREAWREPAVTGLFLLFPALMVGFYFYAFGDPARGMANLLTVLVCNQDAGPQGAELVLALRLEQFDGQAAFTIQEVSDPALARIPLQEKQAALLVTIPANFSQELANRAGPALLRYTRDPYDDLGGFAATFVDGVVEQFSNRLSGWNRPSAGRYEFVAETGTLNDFQFGVPGLLVFGILFGVITAALVLVRETVSGTLQRLRLSRVSAGQIILGLLLSQAALGLAQLPITLGLAAAFGFRSQGSLLLVGGVCLAMSLCASAFGMITACFSKNDGEATNLSLVFIAPLVFLSNAVFPLPPLPLFSLGGYTLQLADLLPSFHATEALRRVILYGDGLPQVSAHLVWMTAQVLLILLAAIWLFHHLRLRQR
jgi:ABC-2 type transport system permease protein